MEEMVANEDKGTLLKDELVKVELYLRRGNKDETLLLPNSEAFEGKSRWFSYYFVRPIFLTSIEIISEGYSSYDKFDIEVTHVDGTKHQEPVAVNAGVVKLRLGKFVTGFAFRPEKKWLSEPKILNVISTGYTEKEFHEFEWAIKEYQASLEELQKREGRLQEQLSEFAALKTERVEIESAIGKARAESDQLFHTLAATKVTVERLQLQEKDLRQKNDSAAQSLRDTSAQIEQASAKLTNLTRELRLFFSEISGFVAEGNRSIKSYAIIGAPFLLILCSVLGLLFVNAVDLTQIYKEVEGVDIWTIFLTRIPFVLVALALIEASGYIVGRLTFEIIRINRQRVEFSKLSIIAKDVSTAAATRTEGMTEEELHRAETELKMALLREHMRNYVGSEFEYKGTGLIAAIKGVADRLSKKPSE